MLAELNWLLFEKTFYKMLSVFVKGILVTKKELSGMQYSITEPYAYLSPSN